MKDKCVAIIEKQIIMKHNVNWVTNIGLLLEY